MKLGRRFVPFVALVLAGACSGEPDAIAVTGKVLLAGEADHSGVLVSLAGRSAVTDREGAWRVELLSGGTFVIHASAEGTLEGTKATLVEVPDEGPVTAPEVTLTPVGEVEGKVTVGLAMGNSGISVSVAGASAVAATDDSGNYILRNVPAGTRTLEVAAPGYAQETVQIQVSRAGRANAGTVVLSRSGQPFMGKATLLGASDHSGTVVKVEGTELTAVTTAGGQFSISAPDGVYTMTFRNGAHEQSVPNVAFLGGIPFLAEAGLQPLPPLVLPQAKHLARAKAVGVPPPWDGFGGDPFPLKATVGGGAFVFMSDVAYVVTFDEWGVPTVRAQGTLNSVTSTGGSSRTLGTGVTCFRLTPDGARVLFATTSGTLHLGNIATGEVISLGSITFAGDFEWMTPYFMSSPDGSRVVLLKRRFPYGDIHIVGSSGGSRTLLGTNVTPFSFGVDSGPGVFSADGSRLFFRGAEGFMVADLRSLVVDTITASAHPKVEVTPDRSTAIALASGALILTRLSPTSSTSSTIETGVQDFVLSGDGSRIIYRASASPSVVKQWVLSSGAPQTLGTNAYEFKSFSPDSQQLLLVEHDPVANNYSLINYELASSTRRVLWTGAGIPSLTQYSSNGAWVAFQVGTNLYTVSATGSGLRMHSNIECCVAISPSNDRVAYISGSSRTLQVVPLTTGSAVTLGAGVDSFAFVAGGSSIVVQAGEVLRVNNSATGANEAVLTESVRSFRLSPDGTAVVFIGDDGLARGVRLTTNASRMLAERVVNAAWVDSSRVILVREGTPAPGGFQDGLYLATVP